jgi:hypothetical protein
MIPGPFIHLFIRYFILFAPRQGPAVECLSLAGFSLRSRRLFLGSNAEALGRTHENCCRLSADGILVWLSALCSLLLALPAHAETLLAEIGLAAPSSSPPGFRFAAQQAEGNWPMADWRILDATESQTVWADPARVAEFDAILTTGPVVGIWQSVAGHSSPLVQFEVLVDGDPCCGLSGERHAPMLGPALTGYTVTALERTLTIGDTASQVVRIYGEVDTDDPLIGDYNGNGTVDAADWVIVTARWDGPWEVGYQQEMWRFRKFFGLSRGAAAGASTVPEPASAFLVLTLIGHLFFFAGGSRGSRSKISCLTLLPPRPPVQKILALRSAACGTLSAPGSLPARCVHGLRIGPFEKRYRLVDAAD